MTDREQLCDMLRRAGLGPASVIERYDFYGFDGERFEDGCRVETGPLHLASGPSSAADSDWWQTAFFFFDSNGALQGMQALAIPREPGTVLTREGVKRIAP